MMFFRNYILPVTLLLFFFSGCNEVNKKAPKKSKIIKTFYPTGNIKAEKEIDKDSIANGYGKLYYPTGNIKILTHFKDGLEHGKKVVFYPGGKIEYTGHFYNGLGDSTWTWFYPTGEVELKYSMSEGEILGEYISYYKSGNIKEYSFYNIKGHKVYKRSYSSDGSLISSKGEPLIMTILNRGISHNRYEVKDTLSISVYVANPPDLTNVLSLTLKTPTGPKEKKDIPVNSTKIDWMEVLRNEGQYRLVIKLESQNKATGETKECIDQLPLVVEKGRVK